MKPIPFQKQYIECHENNFHGKGEIIKFKDHPELLPPPWHKAARVFAEKLKEDPDFGLEDIKCLKFGGVCSSRHEQCRKMRGLKPMSENKPLSPERIEEIKKAYEI